MGLPRIGCRSKHAPLPDPAPPGSSPFPGQGSKHREFQRASERKAPRVASARAAPPQSTRTHLVTHVHLVLAYWSPHDAVQSSLLQGGPEAPRKRRVMEVPKNFKLLIEILCIDPCPKQHSIAVRLVFLHNFWKTKF